MNNKIIIGIAVVVALAVAAFLFTRGGNEIASDNMSADSATQASVENGSIKSLYLLAKIANVLSPLQKVAMSLPEQFTLAAAKCAATLPQKLRELKLFLT